MNAKILSLLIGGLAPAVLYGLAGFFQKWSARAGGSVALYLIGFGLATVLVGIVSRIVLPQAPARSQPLIFALLGGLSFALGAGLISFALIRFDAPIAQLSPLYNMNLLVTVILGLYAFAELQELNPLRLLPGAALILVGGWLVASA